MFANSPGDLRSIPGWFILKTQKMVLDVSLLNTQNYRERIKGKMGQFWEMSSVLHLHLGVVAIEKWAFGSPSTTVTNFTYSKFNIINRLIGLVGRVFANGPVDRGSIPGRVIPKTKKMVLDTSLLKTQQYKLRIKGNVEQYRERRSALPYTSV